MAAGSRCFCCVIVDKIAGYVLLGLQQAPVSLGTLAKL